MCATPLIILEVKCTLLGVICLSGAHFKDDDAIYAFLGRELEKGTYLERKKWSDSTGTNQNKRYQADERQ